MTEYNSTEITGANAFNVAVPQSLGSTAQIESALGEYPQPSTLNSQPSSDPPDWYERARQCRAEEWALANELLALSRRLLIRHLAQAKGSISLSQVERLLQLATKLARLASGSAKNPGSETECRECCRAREAMQAAIKRVYGDAATDEAARAKDADGTPNLGQTVHN